MTDITILDRAEKIGKRIKTERERLGITQGELGEKITEILNSEGGVAQATISGWERGKQIPPLNQILVLSKIFGCDCGYLLCDYDQRTHDSREICASTGLSERSVNYLCALNTWGDKSEAETIDFLLLDAQERDKSHHFRSVLDLLRFFLEYDDSSAPKKQIFRNGYIANYEGGGIMTSAIALDSRIVENAALMEMEQALINLKHIKKQRMGASEHG